MEPPVVEAMEAEITSLERKLVRLREALAEYKGEAPQAEAAHVSPMLMPSGAGRGRRRVLGVPNINGQPTQTILGGGFNESEGFKLVPLKKVDRIRIGAREFLRVQPQHKAHRSAVAEHLKKIGILGDVTDPIASLSVYFAKWPEEFYSDGKGNVVLIDAAPNGGAHE